MDAHLDGGRIEGGKSHMRKPKLFSLEALQSETPEEGLEEFVEKFLTDRKREVAALREATHLEMSQIGKLAHQWKGFSEPYGFATLGMLARELEQAAKTDKKEECRMFLDEIALYLSEKEKLIAL